jgi:hypothetical protein
LGASSKPSVLNPMIDDSSFSDIYTDNNEQPSNFKRNTIKSRPTPVINTHLIKTSTFDDLTASKQLNQETNNRRHSQLNTMSDAQTQITGSLTNIVNDNNQKLTITTKQLKELINDIIDLKLDSRNDEDVRDLRQNQANSETIVSSLGTTLMNSPSTGPKSPVVTNTPPPPRPPPPKSTPEVKLITVKSPAPSESLKTNYNNRQGSSLFFNKTSNYTTSTTQTILTTKRLPATGSNTQQSVLVEFKPKSAGLHPNNNQWSLSSSLVHSSTYSGNIPNNNSPNSKGLVSDATTQTNGKLIKLDKEAELSQEAKNSPKPPIKQSNSQTPIVINRQRNGNKQRAPLPPSTPQISISSNFSGSVSSAIKSRSSSASSGLREKRNYAPQPPLRSPQIQSNDNNKDLIINTTEAISDYAKRLKNWLQKTILVNTEEAEAAATYPYNTTIYIERPINSVQLPLKPPSPAECAQIRRNNSQRVASDTSIKKSIRQRTNSESLIYNSDNNVRPPLSKKNPNISSKKDDINSESYPCTSHSAIKRHLEQHSHQYHESNLFESNFYEKQREQQRQFEDDNRKYNENINRLVTDQIGETFFNGLLNTTPTNSRYESRITKTGLSTFKGSPSIETKNNVYKSNDKHHNFLSSDNSTILISDDDSICNLKVNKEENNVILILFLNSFFFFVDFIFIYVLFE